jgi:very-short-patch-repair endonuclease
MSYANQDFLLRLICGELAKRAGTDVEFEHRFHPVRKWRFDAAFPAEKVAVEIDGGTFVQGRHTRGVGFKNDCEKLNEAALLGWRIFRFLPAQLGSGEVYDVLKRALL